MIRLLVLTALLLTQPASGAPCLHNCRVSPAGKQLVKKYEGFFPFLYKDAAGYPSIGFGHLIRTGEVIEQPLLGAAADNLLESDLNATAQAVNRLVTVSLYQPQADSLISLTFNIGAGRLQRSTLLRYVNAERHADVPAQFRLWIYAGGKPLKGLIARRNAEAGLYATGGSQ